MKDEALVQPASGSRQFVASINQTNPRGREPKRNPYHSPLRNQSRQSIHKSPTNISTRSGIKDSRDYASLLNHLNLLHWVLHWQVNRQSNKLAMATNHNNKKRSEVSLEEPAKWKRKTRRIRTPVLLPRSHGLRERYRTPSRFSPPRGVFRVQRRAVTGSEVTKTGARKTSDSGLTPLGGLVWAASLGRPCSILKWAG
jgi:hypothetical protein